MKSPFWYLLPAFLGIIGGVIAYAILKNNDPQKAKRALLIGLIVTIPFFVWTGFTISSGTSNPFYVVATSGMIPVLQVYDIIGIQGHEPFEEVQVGDIIVFDRPSDHNRVIVHRVQSILEEDPKTIRTQGDANPSWIRGTDYPITEEEYIGKVAYIIPQVGYITQILKPPVNYIIIAIVIGVMVIKQITNKKKKSEDIISKETLEELSNNRVFCFKDSFEIIRWLIRFFNIICNSS